MLMLHKVIIMRYDKEQELLIARTQVLKRNSEEVQGGSKSFVNKLEEEMVCLISKEKACSGGAIINNENTFTLFPVTYNIIEEELRKQSKSLEFNRLYKNLILGENISSLHTVHNEFKGIESTNNEQEHLDEIRDDIVDEELNRIKVILILRVETI
jgi:hypothetical protein